MLVITATVWPGGDEALKFPIGEITAGNLTMRGDHCDYLVTLSQTANAALRIRAADLEFLVTGVDRRQSVWSLMRTILEAAPSEISGSQLNKRSARRGAQITERQRICLAYLDNKMEANAAMIGEEIVSRLRDNAGTDPAAVGANVVGRLRRKGLVSRLPELQAWRITAAGRAALQRTE